MRLDVWKCHEKYGKLFDLCHGDWTAVRADAVKALTSVMLPTGL